MEAHRVVHSVPCRPIPECFSESKKLRRWTFFYVDPPRHTTIEEQLQSHPRSHLGRFKRCTLMEKVDDCGICHAEKEIVLSLKRGFSLKFLQGFSFIQENTIQEWTSKDSIEEFFKRTKGHFVPLGQQPAPVYPIFFANIFTPWFNSFTSCGATEDQIINCLLAVTKISGFCEIW